jgi:hypothetical protein
MAWKRNVLVVANVTATSAELVDALKARAANGPSAAFTLIVPATPTEGGRAAAQEKCSAAVEQLRDAGLEAEGIVGDADPFMAVTDAWDPKRYDEIVVSTLPNGSSKWLHAGLPERIGRLTNAPVSHVVCRPPRAVAPTVPAPPRDRVAMGPLSVLGWGGHKDH